MERGNTKHGPVLDGEMAHEFQEGRPELGVVREGGAPPGMTYDEVEERSRLGRYIPRSSLPGDREQLIRGAAELDAPDDVIQQLAGLPAGEKFQTVNEIWAALGHHNEERRT
jgi:hypothetical protein